MVFFIVMRSREAASSRFCNSQRMQEKSAVFDML